MFWRYSDLTYRLKPLKTFYGDRKTFTLERKTKIGKITLDSLSLYFLEVLGCLELLRNCDSVYIDFKTVSALTSDLLKNEDNRIRRIFNFLHSSTNIVYVFPSKDSKEVILKFIVDEERMQAFSCLLNACAVAHDNNVPLVYLDAITQPIAMVTKTQTISLLNFILAAFNNGWITADERVRILISMSTHGFEFLCLCSEDLYDILKTNNFKVDETNEKLFEIPIIAEALSYVSVYAALLRRLRVDGNREIMEKLALIFAEMFDKRHGRTRESFWRAKDSGDSAETARISLTRQACEVGVAGVCAYLLDFKTDEELVEIISNRITRIPAETLPHIAKTANEIYSDYLKDKK